MAARFYMCQVYTHDEIDFQYFCALDLGCNSEAESVIVGLGGKSLCVGVCVRARDLCACVCVCVCME